VARDYRQALLQADPAACRAVDQRIVHDLGQDWLTPTLASLNLDEWVTIPEAADYVGLTPAAVYKWVYRNTLEGRTGADRRLRVRLGAVLDTNAEYRRRRAERRADP
jgi:hypothetical protein